MAAHQQHQILEEKSSREGNNNNMMVSSSPTSFCYSDVVPHHHHLGQNFDPNPEIYNLNSGIEMIGFQPKAVNTHHHDHHNHGDENPSEMVITSASQQMGFMEDCSSRPCVFPCERNERPSQGLSLSLSSTYPSTISLQSFELRHNHHQRFSLSSPSSTSRDGFLHHHHQEQSQVFLGKSVVGGSTNMNLQFDELIRNSKYMEPAQQLLNEFCNLGNPDDPNKGKKAQSRKNKEQWHLDEGDVDHQNPQNNNASSCSSSRNNALYGVNLMELQKRKTNLLGMLEQVIYTPNSFFHMLHLL